MTKFANIRMRRLRKSPAMRQLLDLPVPGPEKFIWPVFVREGEGMKETIDAMPGQFRLSIDTLLVELERIVEMNIGGILIFGLPNADVKNATGSDVYDDNGIVQRAVRAVKEKFPKLLVITDVCVCAYTTHGHCGTLDCQENVDNDLTLKTLSKMAVSHAEAGADIVAPSAMMDGQVAAIRAGLDTANFLDTPIMSYSTKFASAMYGPFREAEQSAPGKGDRQGYQQSYADASQAIRESLIDEEEGADFLMVKPAMLYLDVIAKIKERSDLPLAIYNVSGEYSMLHAMADRGWGDLKAMVRENIIAFSRAGADIIISYWANQYDELFRN